MMKKIAATISILFMVQMIAGSGQIDPPKGDQDPKPIFSFGIVTDVHLTDQDSSGTKYYRESAQKLEEALGDFAGDSVAFVINLGDVIDNDFNSYKRVNEIIGSSGLKVYHCLGNHDFSVAKNKKRRNPLEIPKNGYYSFIYGEFRFIILNGNEISTYAPTNKKELEEAANYLGSLKERGDINAQDWNGGIGVDQLEWFMGEMDQAKAAGEEVFIFCHFPVYPENMHNLLNSVEALSAMKGYDNIIAWFSGHNHAGNYGNLNQTHFITLKGMVETESTNSYTRVDVYSNRIWLNGSGRERSMILAY